MKSTSTYSHAHTVTLEEIDHLNHVNNVVYLQWVQEIAKKHWSILSNKELDAKYSWVVIRHEIDYKKQALLHDKLLIKTSIGETSGLTSIRYVEIFKEDLLIAKAKTTWVLISNKTFKPTRITQEILNTLKLS